MKPGLQLIASLLLGLAMPVTGHAHEMGTSALQLHELSPGHGMLSFKRSQSADGQLPPIAFHFSGDCALGDARTTAEDGTEVTQQARFDCRQPLREQSLAATGFTRLAPDLIVHVRHHDGHQATLLLGPSHPQTALAQATPASPSGGFRDYLITGMEHILLGWDHVLFIAGVFLLWHRTQASPWRLAGQFTLFTLGHSLTLALLVLGWISLPTRLIESWIALSVLWLACQLSRADSTPAATPWPLLLGFGLLHGSGFALSMQDKGFPEQALASTLVAFNLGIELGQLLIVAALGMLLMPLRGRRAETFATQALTLIMGGAALYWTIQRMTAYAQT